MRDGPSIHSREHAELLLHKAQHDEFALEKLIPDPASPDEIIGFHAQQAIEKTLKAVLTNSAIYYGRTHNLGVLLDLPRANNIPFPLEFQEIRRLAPFAAVFHYGDMAPQLTRPFDRFWARGCVRKARAWAESALRDKERS
jgi:HEPN domain-containing protein